MVKLENRANVESYDRTFIIHFEYSIAISIVYCDVLIKVLITDQKDDRIEPVVFQDECNDEESDTQKDGYTSDDVDKVMNLLGDWCITRVQAGRQISNTTHDRTIAGSNDDARARALDCVRAKESDVTRLERIIAGEFGRTRLRLGLARQRRVVHLEAHRLDHAYVGRQAIAELDFDYVADD